MAPGKPLILDDLAACDGEDFPIIHPSPGEEYTILATGRRPASLERCMSNSMWPRCGVSAAIFRGSEVLLVERGKAPLRGLWSLPGGHIEPGEPARVAALREVREETGVAAQIEGLIDIHEVMRRDESGTVLVHYLLAVFFGHWRSGEPAAAEDVTAARFVPVNAAASLPLTEGALSFIHRAVDLQSAWAAGRPPGSGPRQGHPSEIRD